MKKYLILFFLFFIMVVGVAGKTSQSVTGVNAIDIQFNEFSSIKQSANYTFHFHLFGGSDGMPITAQGGAINCSFHMYNEWGGNHIMIDWEDTFTHIYDIEFYADENNFTELGEYAYVVQCVCETCGYDQAAMGGYLAYAFEVTETGNDDETSFMPLAVIILLPMLLGIIFILAIISLNEEHSVLKIFLFLLLPILFWVSLHFSLVVVTQMYSFPILQDLVGTTAYWSGWLFIILLTYFIIYFIYKAFKTAAQDKDERLKY